MGDKCFDLNPACMAKAEGDARRPCPAYEQRIGCFELDWKPLYAQLSGEHKSQMLQWMKDNCPRCPVYSIHRVAIDDKIAAL